MACILALGSLVVLAGCQGVSNGGNSDSTPPASGQLTPTAASLGFGSVTVGNDKSLSETVTNTGSSSITLSQLGISGSGFSFSGISSPVTLAAGQGVTFNVTFTPSAAGNASGNLTITSTASDSTLTIPLSGTGTAAPVGQLNVSPSTLAIGNVVVGSSGTASGSLSASGASVTVTATSSSNSAFSVSGLSLPVTIAAGDSVPFTVTFTPQTTGSASATLTFTSNAQTPTSTDTATGTGTAVAAGQLGVSPSTLALGNVVDGTSGTASGSLTASGASVTITAASTNNSVFSVGGLSLPVTIPAGQSVPFTVTFSPQTTGTASATLTFTSTAQPSTTTETLTGTGTAAPTYSVNLSWEASTSPNISGYNIYRAVYTSSCGSFSKINSSLNTSTLYTDTVVIDGSSYCYATTAVNSSDEESGYSNIVSNVQIPSP